MPCLLLGKGLFPAVRIWKNFTTKLQRRLHKLHPCKIINMTRTRRSKTARAPPPVYYPPLPSMPKRRRRHRANHQHQLFGSSKALRRPKHNYHFKKQSLQAAPVFIDELFWSRVTEGKACLPGSSMSVLEEGKPKVKTEPATSSAVLRIEQAQAPPEMSADNTSSADEVWESVAMASPLMREIDDRAEEFITRFRAELELQEMIAHRL